MFYSIFMHRKVFEWIVALENRVKVIDFIAEKEKRKRAKNGWQKNIFLLFYLLMGFLDICLHAYSQMVKTLDLKILTMLVRFQLSVPKANIT